MDTFLDIETIPSQHTGIMEDIKDAISPPANYKKPEAIAKWWAEHGDAAIEDKYRKTALDGGYGEVVCVCYAVEDGDVNVVTRDSSMGEETMLAQFWAEILVIAQMYGGRRPLFIGHNIQWDLQFLWKRSIINNIPPPIPLPWRDAPWKGSYIDTINLWCGAQNKISLTNLCKILSIEVDDDVSGSDVWDLWQVGDYAKIASHCVADVEKVREVYRRIR